MLHERHKRVTKRNKSAIFIAFFSIFAVSSAIAQVAGINTLSVLQMPSSARTAALGVSWVSLYDPTDLGIAIDNPSLIPTRPDNRIVLNHTNLFSGSSSTSIAYGIKSRQLGSFLFALRYNGHGKFQGYDQMENEEGEFSASDFALTAGWKMDIDSNYSLGASLTPIRSQYESYTAWAFALSVAATYVSDDKRFAATLQGRNIGAQLSTFDNSTESLPFDLAASLSYKASKAPFRLFLMADNLTKWRLDYEDPLTDETTNLFGDSETDKEAWYKSIEDVIDIAGRHLSAGVEANIGKHLYVRVGYRFRQTAEMSAVSRTNINLSGFCYGFGISTKRFDFAFARRNYHLGQAPNFLSLSIKL